MKSHRPFFGALILLLSMVLPSCGSDSSSSPGPAGTGGTGGNGGGAGGTGGASGGKADQDAGKDATGGITDGGIGLACGDGTVVQNGFCVPSAPPLVCGPGTVAVNGQCVVAPAPSLAKVRLTTLKVKYDVTKPAYINNALALHFGITASSSDNAKPVKGTVNVTFSFIEPVPSDPAAPKRCDSNGIDVTLIGDGTEQFFDADIFPADDCKELAGQGATVNLAVDFDKGLRLSMKPTGIDYPPLDFTAATASSPNNQLCHKSSDATMPGAGCVYDIALQPTPLDANGKPQINMQLESLAPESAVAMAWSTQQDPDVPAGQHETTQPSMVVNLALSLEGRDPYKHKVDPSKVPPELIASDPTILDDLKFGLSDADLDALDDLPGTLAVKYDIAPTQALANNVWKSLGIDDPKNPAPDGHVTEIDLTEVEPGAVASFCHELYIEGDALTAVSTGGDWEKFNLFTVRGCIIPSFPEGGNTGDPDDGTGAGVPASDNCKTFPVRLVRATRVLPLATSHSFDMTWTRAVGSADRLQISGTLRSNNSLDLNGARSDSEGTLDLAGRIGSDFKVQLARAFGKASALTTRASSSLDVGIEAFGVSIFSYQNSAAEFTYSQTFMVAKSFQFPVLSYGFGPVSVGITAGVGGNIGLTPNFVIAAKEGGEPSIPELANATSNGLLTVGITPNIGLTGNVTGGIDVFVAKAAVVATLQVVDVGLPITGTLRWGVTQLDGTNVKQMTVVGNVSTDLTLTWLNASIDLIGKIGVGWFSASTTINIFKYENPQEVVNLLSRRLGTPIVLE